MCIFAGPQVMFYLALWLKPPSYFYRVFSQLDLFHFNALLVAVLGYIFGTYMTVYHVSSPFMSLATFFYPNTAAKRRFKANSPHLPKQTFPLSSRYVAAITFGAASSFFISENPSGASKSPNQQTTSALDWPAASSGCGRCATASPQLLSSCLFVGSLLILLPSFLPRADPPRSHVVTANVTKPAAHHHSTSLLPAAIWCKGSPPTWP